jgi:hypothetical protein
MVGEKTFQAFRASPQVEVLGTGQRRERTRVGADHGDPGGDRAGGQHEQGRGDAAPAWTGDQEATTGTAQIDGPDGAVVPAHPDRHRGGGRR